MFICLKLCWVCLYSYFQALLYGCTNTAIEKARGVEDEYNSIAAGITTGVLFKSTGLLIFNCKM